MKKLAALIICTLTLFSCKKIESFQKDEPLSRVFSLLRDSMPAHSYVEQPRNLYYYNFCRSAG